MTRFLKLVRHEDGKWKALPTETDDLAQVSLKERKYAPIDPDQLLKALDSLLSPEGGIKSVEDAPRLASLVKKFSKKLVSRCVYCNVLQATQPEILSEYLDKGGWETINVWLQYAKSSASPSFLVEMLNLCKLLPMTVERLKENNTAKLIKSLLKSENSDVKSLSSDLVTKWMSIIKGKKSDAPPVEKKKKKEKEKQKSEEKKEEKTEKKLTTETKKVAAAEPVSKAPVKLKGTKRTSSDKDAKKTEYYEDVKIDPEPLYPISKKPKPDRPKTAKLYQKKFRATGLEEATPLPKKMAKKGSPVDKSAAVAAAKNALRLNSVLPDRITEKKLKPESLMTINENTSSNKGIKLIPAKPQPAYVLHESASFIDALIPQPAVVKKKKRVPNKVTTSPTSPTLQPPKFSFYKDTLEMNDDQSKKEESEKENITDGGNEGSPKKEETTLSSPPVDEPMETTEDGGHTPTNNEEVSNPAADTENSDDLMEERKPFDPNHLRSILSHGRRRGRKKTVKWKEEENIKEVFYFDTTEEERVNVYRTQKFIDMKSIELRREREALEMAKRQAEFRTKEDKMEETARWWTMPILIDVPPPPIEPGCLSQERERERIRQQSTLQEIYFTKEMIPDSPHEPDLEIVPQEWSKTIPLETENGSFVDYSNFELPTVLPKVLSSLTEMVTNVPGPQPVPNHILDQPMMDTSTMNGPMNSELINQPNIPMSMAAPYDPAEPLTGMAPNSLLGPPPMQPNMYGMGSPPMSEPSGGPNIAQPHNDWRPMDMGQPDPYYQGNHMNSNMNSNSNMNYNMNPTMTPNMNSNMNPNMNSNMMPEPRPGMNMRPRMMNDMYRPPNMHKGPPRGMGPRPRNIHRVPCRHFIAGSCRFGMKCSFLHPGVNGPPL